MKKLSMAVCLACVFASAAASAGQERDDKGESRFWTPIGLSIISPPVQLPSPSHSVFGAMVNLGYGQLDNLTFLDVGIVNNVTEGMYGLEVGPVNLSGACFGAQVGAVNIASMTAGVQLGVLNMTGDLHGLQVGLLNFSRSGGALVFPIINLGF
ncbi:MAG: hypothetical protein IKE55_08715 [Kiritimatiellae bacterium]|nr:hypothetical protein [Kiritimatiellia bacterium]